MTQVCNTCAHKDRKRIDKELIQGISITVLSRRYGISTDSLYRHRESHIGAAALDAGSRALKSHGLAVLDQLADLSEKTNEILDSALKDGHRSMGLKAVVQCRGNLELISKIEFHILQQQQVMLESRQNHTPEHEYLNDAWRRNFAKLPKAEQQTFSRILTKCFCNTNPNRKEEDPGYDDIEPIEEIPAPRKMRRKPKPAQ